MSDEGKLDALVRAATARMAKCWQCPMGRRTDRPVPLAGQRAVHDVLEALIFVLFPGCHADETVIGKETPEAVAATLGAVAATLTDHVQRAFAYQCLFEHGRECKQCSDCRRRAEEVIARFLEALPDVQARLQTDIVAAYEGDPAAKSTMEVVQSYPGLRAITVHRIAHVLYREGVPLIPRVMSEKAHAETGIDIHPGARIGEAFFIDHGTGVVIGETCVIGKRVKMYQGVTLGALSFEKDEQGRLVKGVKRHPDVEDGVIIYAGATILGGRTTIGAHSVIGGNVWLTHSVPPHSLVYNQQPRPLIRPADVTWEGGQEPWTDVGGGI